MCDERTRTLCVACTHTATFLCEKHERPCAWCAAEGPFCEDCRQCGACKAGGPGAWRCGGCKEVLHPAGFRQRCVDCDATWRCIDCVRVCRCGRGEGAHYVCREDWHNCARCPQPTCSKYGTLELAVGSVCVCAEHRRATKKRQRELTAAQSIE